MVYCLNLEDYLRMAMPFSIVVTKLKESIYLLIVLGVLIPGQVLSQCTGVDFAANTTTACAPALLSFTASGVPIGSSFNWRFNSTAMSGNDTISYFFTKKGLYTIEMDAIIPGLGTCTVTKSAYVNIYLPDTPVLVVDKPKLCNGSDTVLLRNTKPGFSRIDWIVEAQNLQNKGDSLKYLFVIPGIKHIGVKVYDAFGCPFLKMFDSAIVVNYTPVINIIPSKTQGCKPIISNFSIATNQPSRQIVSYDWQFPGATPSTATGATPQNIKYLTSGNYNVTVTIKMADSCVYTKTQPFAIYAEDTIIPTFTISDSVGCAGTVTTLINTSSLAQFPGSFFWSFSGGGNNWNLLTDTTKKKDTLNIIFYNPALYSIKLDYLRNGCLLTNHKINSVHVFEVNNGFTSTDNVSCVVPDTIHLENTSAVLTGKNFTWQLRDSKGNVVDSIKQKDAAFRITNPGMYTVVLISDKPGKCKHLTTATNYIKITKPKAKAKFDSVACAESEVRFEQDVFPFSSDTIKYKWMLWNRDSTDTLRTGKDEVFKYTYNDTGYFDLTFITYTGQCADTLRKDSAVHLIRYKGGIKNTFANAYCVGVPVSLWSQVKVTPANSSKMTADWTFTHETNPAVVVKASGVSPGSPPDPPFKATAAFSVPGRYNAQMVLHDGNHKCIDTSRIDTVIRVSDVDVEVNVPVGCLPYSAPITTTTKYNYHFGNPANNKISHVWRLQIDTFICWNKDSANYYYNVTGDTCKMKIFRPQIYDVSVRITNSDNCNKFYYKQFAIDVMRGGVIDIPDSGCKGITVPSQNMSFGTHHKYKWIANKPTIKFVPSDTSFAPQLEFIDTGYTRVIMEAYDTLLGCIDRDTDWVYVNSLEMSFSTIDTFKKCAPALVNFNVQGAPGTTYTWSFGDGDSIVTMGTDIYHLYRKNSGTTPSDGFSVYLKGVSTLGCENTIIKNNLIKILGPVPKFDLLDTIGCEPYPVRFVNQSQYLKSFYYDYGDGSPIDSSTINPNHVYTVKNPNVSYEVFKPRLLAYDNDFCFSIYEGFDSVVVHRKPVAAFMANKQQACQAEPIVLTDTTALSAKRYWDINNDLVPDDSAQASTFSFLPGFHDVRLRVVTSAGCADTLYQSKYILINPSPEIDFSVGDTELCYKNPVGLVLKYNSFIPLKSQLWEFMGTTGMEDTSTLKNPYYQFKTPGYKHIKLTVNDSNNCVGSIQKNNVLLVLDTVISSFPVIKNVSVDLGHAVTLNWGNPSPVRKFDEYRLYRSTPSIPWVEAAAFRNQTDTVWVDLSRLAKDEPVSYRFTQSDRCATESSPSPEFTTIHTRVQSTVHGINRISWTPFKGYTPAEIRVYEAPENKATEYSLMAVLPAASSEYMDSNLCPVEKFYRVQAVSNTDTALFSYSNFSSKIPFYELPLQVPLVRVATVEDNKDVEVNFINPYTRKGEVIVDRYDTLYGWRNELENLSGPAPSMTDKQVQVNKYVYQYKAKFRDTCGLESGYGNVGSNILLKGLVYDDMPHLKWTPYKEWPLGVSHYLVQIWRNGTFKTLAKTTADTLTWTDEKVHMEIDTAYIYRIVAVSADMKDTSISNYKSLTLDSRIWIPSAFTPNEDGLNDVFMPVAIGIYNDSPLGDLEFSMQIYNRWGELVFESNNIFYGWDGKFRGVECPEGVYSYSVKAIGVDNEKHIRRGTVTLMR